MTKTFSKLEADGVLQYYGLEKENNSTFAKTQLKEIIRSLDNVRERLNRIEQQFNIKQEKKFMCPLDNLQQLLDRLDFEEE